LQIYFRFLIHFHFDIHHLVNRLHVFVKFRFTREYGKTDQTLVVSIPMDSLVHLIMSGHIVALGKLLTANWTRERLLAAVDLKS
jgi:hypothetical protein